MKGVRPEEEEEGPPASSRVVEVEVLAAAPAEAATMALSWLGEWEEAPVAVGEEGFMPFIILRKILLAAASVVVDCGEVEPSSSPWWCPKPSEWMLEGGEACFCGYRCVWVYICWCVCMYIFVGWVGVGPEVGDLIWKGKKKELAQQGHLFVLLMLWLPLPRAYAQGSVI